MIDLRSKALIQRLMLVTLLVSFFSYPILASEDVSGSVTLEARSFPETGAYEQQSKENYSMAATIKFETTWDQDRNIINLELFYRADSTDKERTHFDIRELSFQTSGEMWDVGLGIGRFFWGVTESQHLVDVINQTDAVENFDGEQKLGQPFVKLSLLDVFGDFHFFVLPSFRERTFAGEKGRFRLALVVDTDNPIYESSAQEKHVDYAFRWEKTVDSLDLGVSHFSGTSRDPFLRAAVDADGNAVLRPEYKLMNQTGVDIQVTLDNTLLKHESIYRNYNDAGEADFFSQTSGFEYTFYGVVAQSDVGLLMEYLSHNKGEDSGDSFEDDLFIAARITLNDVDSTEILAGVFKDRDTSTTVSRLEASRRVGDSLKVSFETLQFNSIDDADALTAFKKDSYYQLGLSGYF
ncbi:MAG: hypothetical protein COB67_09475 [SAR324 cluster bacterium]|uniref:Uncharacterized protein n=1 Tax=SAR324 cluster bacterium TaxID=2024889 RepID=A0A2A4T0G3_9DELT|nr:MAG: hypothetical protein COB67_09475 [SAR324 cluster bacterium]